LRIIVYEHVSGGGYADQPISPDVLAEGFAMLRTMTSDFKAAGHEITILLDSRLSKLNLPISADCTVPIFYSEEPKKFLVSIAKINDAVYVVAPETGQTLHFLVALVEQTGKVSLNCQSSTIQKVADKTVLYDILKRNGLPTPKTLVLNMNDTLGEVKRSIKNKLTYPLIFKPADGVSCGGLSLLKEDGLLENAIEKIKATSTNEHFMIQEFIEGEAASVSLLCAKGNAVAISLNHQTVKVGGPAEVSSYEGGAVPFDHPLKQKAFVVAKKAAECFAGLRGYVGVDFVLAKNKLFMVDVNPRLTTSYVGLSRIANFNVAQAIVDAVLKDKLSAKNEKNGYICFSKLETPAPSISAFQDTEQLTEVVSPPFPLSENQKGCALIASEGQSMDDAKKHLEEAKKRVLSIIIRGK